MSKAVRIKEQIGWLKVVFGLFVGADFALLGWLKISKVSWRLLPAKE